MFLVSERWVGDGTDCYIWTQSSSNHSRTSFSSWRGYSTVDDWGSKPSVWSWFSVRHLVPNWYCNRLPQTGTDCPKLSVAPGYIIVSCNLLPVGVRIPNSTGQGDIPTGCTCFAVLTLIYTGASLDWRIGRGWICYKGLRLKLSFDEENPIMWRYQWQEKHSFVRSLFVKYQLPFK